MSAEKIRTPTIENSRKVAPLSLELAHELFFVGMQVYRLISQRDT